MSRTAVSRPGMAAVAAVLAVLVSGGARSDPSVQPRQPAPAFSTARTSGYNTDRNAYFGDLHVHTKFSFDAYIFNVRATPDDAYNYAKGATVRHAGGYDVRLTDAPLDFLAVTDHAEYLGIVPAMNDPASPLSRIPYAPQLFSRDPAKIQSAFAKVATSIGEGRELPELHSPETSSAAWGSIVASAQRHNEPGRLTTFIGYEFTSAPQGMNLHRNVIFSGSRAPEAPFTALQSQNPEDLWRWMDGYRARTRNDVLAIPHNMNGSDGRMYERTSWDGRAIDKAYADLRIRNEPLAEMSQIKGTSETHPSLSPNDEWSNFEIMESYIGTPTPVTRFAGGYVRDALKAGLVFQEKNGFNPFKIGFIGSSDTHNAASGVEEGRYVGKVGFTDGTPERRFSVPPNGARDWHDAPEPSATTARFQQWGAAGLAGVWAEENTREAIFAALRRKETFATSGPRIRVRYFVGYDFPADMMTRTDLVRVAYARGVPMGGDLLPRRGRTPQHLVWAVRDPHAGWLQRVQIVKGWVENGEAKERVFDVACSDGLTPDPRTGRCGDNGATVNLADCGVSENKGAVELRTLWTDPTFDPNQRAFYYVRAIENPSCRWSTWDAIRAGVQPSPTMPKTIQERAWSSPVWYAPRV
ncbi:MAG: hypothetical protein FD160_3445 [Caulobacteraceae bacterium]|nr:MAG: hypothetical protein FD160_3445 [Caulobacteraceae bacterium]